MKHILFLADRMMMGFGVSVVISEFAKQLLSQGWQVSVGCRNHDDFFSECCHVMFMEPDAACVDSYIIEHNISHVVAHTTPYFEVLPKLSSNIKKWAWEHGDPTPSLFPSDSAERQAIISYKRTNVYPYIDRVIAISKFIKQDIDWPLAHVIYNGCDHVKSETSMRNINDPIKVGSLMRLGKGERCYKGGNLYIELVSKLVSEQSNIRFAVLGRGTVSDGKEFEQAGIETHLNASEKEKEDYLSSLDVFISFSLWEGFNLPLVEAQASGKLAIGFDTGAHPEVTPFIVTSTNELARFLVALQNNRELLYQYSIQAHKFCIREFSWDKSANLMLQLLHS